MSEYTDASEFIFYSLPVFLSTAPQAVVSFEDYSRTHSASSGRMIDE
jgi:hypothetical protein